MINGKTKLCTITLTVALLISSATSAFASDWHYFDNEMFTDCGTMISLVEDYDDQREDALSARKDFEDALENAMNNPEVTLSDCVITGGEVVIATGLSAAAVYYGEMGVAYEIFVTEAESFIINLALMSADNNVAIDAKADLENAMEQLSQELDKLNDAYEELHDHRRSHNCLHKIHK